MSKFSGHSCRCLSLHTFIIYQDLQRLKRVWAYDERFSMFVKRKGMHNEDKQNKMHDASPTSFFKDANQMFDKHFMK